MAVKDSSGRSAKQRRKHPAEGESRPRNARRSIAARLDALDWSAIEHSLAEPGWARIRPVLSAAETAGLISLYGDDARFRSTVDMERHSFGRGEYRYFARPLPQLVAELRTELYRRLAPIANRWARALGRAPDFPPTLAQFSAACAAQEQTRPTPLLLRYGPGDFNCLHQDLYGAVAFPLQVAAFLSRPDQDYGGGEFLLVEQRPRAQSRGHAIRVERGELLIFPNAERPTTGKRGTLRTSMRHGVSPVEWGDRVVLGIIFHDAR